MQMRDTGLGFGLVTIVSHWIGALLLPGFLIGSFAALWSFGGGWAARVAPLVALFFAFRLWWRLVHYHPLPLGGAKPVSVLVGRGVQLGMLLAGVVLPLMFLWLKSIGAGQGSLGAWGTVLWVFYHLGALAFGLGWLLHLYGAYTHHVVFKDGTLLRLWGRHVDV